MYDDADMAEPPPIDEPPKDECILWIFEPTPLVECRDVLISYIVLTRDIKE